MTATDKRDPEKDITAHSQAFSVCTREFSSLLQIPTIANMNAAAQLLGMFGVIIYEFSSHQPFAALCQLTLLRAGLTDTVLKTAAGAESCLY